MIFYCHALIIYNTDCYKELLSGKTQSKILYANHFKHRNKLYMTGHLTTTKNAHDIQKYTALTQNNLETFITVLYGLKYDTE